jgi:hypothetical protein
MITPTESRPQCWDPDRSDPKVWARAERSVMEFCIRPKKILGKAGYGPVAVARQPVFSHSLLNTASAITAASASIRIDL